MSDAPPKVGQTKSTQRGFEREVERLGLSAVCARVVCLNRFAQPLERARGTQGFWVRGSVPQARYSSLQRLARTVIVARLGHRLRALARVWFGHGQRTCSHLL